MLEKHAFDFRQFEDRSHGVLYGIDETCRTLRFLLDTAIEPHRAVEGGHLIENKVGKFIVEGFTSVWRHKVPLRPPPVRHCVGNSSD